MASKDKPQGLRSPPPIPLEPRDHAPGPSNADGNGSESQSRIRRRFSRSGRQEAKHIRLQALNPGTKSSSSSIYYGSYSHSPRHSVSSLKSPAGSVPHSPRDSPRVSVSHSHLASLLQDLDVDLETYGVEELRDGFFDGAFVKPPKVDHEELKEDAEDTLPPLFKKTNPLSLKYFLPSQWHKIKGAVQALLTTRAGIKLTKSFLAFFIAYILCLIPTIRIWLGRYSYIAVLSTILNHPGRTIGAQLDGALLTSLGTATGLGWGAFALWLSTSTPAAERGYGGILAAFLALFMGTMAALRSYYVRSYQLVIMAGLAAIYTTLADTTESIRWRKIFDYGIPWLIGQAIGLVVCFSIFPDAGARPLAVSLHSALGIMLDGLTLPHPNQIEIHRQLSMTFVNLSEAYRDLILDVSITRFRPSDIESLRNLMQAVIRSLLSLRMETALFDGMEQPPPRTNSAPIEVPSNFEGEAFTGNPQRISIPTITGGDAVINIESTGRPSMMRTDTGDKAVRLVTSKLSEPTSKLLCCMRNAFEGCDAVLMDMSGYRKYLGPPSSTSSDIVGLLTELRKVMIKYDEEEESLLDNPNLPPTYSDNPEVVELFLFVHPIRQAARSVEALLVKVMEMQQRQLGWRIYLPSYPFKKGLQRTNAQVRHDRGGITVGFYFRSANELAKTMRGMANIYKPLHKKPEPGAKENASMARISRSETMGKYEEEEDVVMDRNSQISQKQRFRYKLWLVLHRLQGFETRFALKVVIVTSLLAVPGWLQQSRGWWNQNESWWAVAMVWIMSHPRVGGNFQDLITRALCGVIGAAWGAFAYAARDGNPYVMAVFAAIYMIPMIYRYTQSSHPRSGIVGCISFVVVSLTAKSNEGQTITTIAWTRGVAFVIGVVSAVVVSWLLWPFVARHELRKAISAMMIYSSIIYRGVVARYVYYEAGNEPGKEDIERSEMLEGRLREGFVRIRQLMALTRHEIRLRGPFDPLPYSALIEACERFFEYLVSVRQSSLFFHPHFISDNDYAVESLLSYRRDAVAAILMNLYVLAGALRGNRKVPRYLPSAALARKRLLDKMAEVEASLAQTREIERIQTGGTEGKGRRWTQVYSYSYSQSLTGCVKQLEQLVQYSKEICGEMGFDPILDDAELEVEGDGDDGTRT